MFAVRYALGKLAITCELLNAREAHVGQAVVQFQQHSLDLCEVVGWGTVHLQIGS